MKPKISIIVPVYNVETHIRKCIDSILAQTIKDFELILINDGSTDNSGQICDEYQKFDNRIKVIHKENGGQASARNFGIDVSKGDYIGFVDSDDWIESDMYELLYNMCTLNDCDIANCTSKIHYSDRVKINGTHDFMVHNRSQAMKAVLEGKLYDEVVWTKLFKRDLLSGIRFPVGVVYEDTAFTYKVIHRAQKVCCIGAPKYNYIKHVGSTMDRAIKNIKIDAVLVYEDMFQFIHKHYSELTNMVALKLANNSLVVLRLMCESDDFLRYRKDYKKVAKILNKYFNKTITLKELPNNVKFLLAAIKVHPVLYKYILKYI